jgi:hypothetical protein
MDYRLYCYDGADKLWVADGIQAESVEEAVAVALGLGNVFKCEVWQGGRLVAKIEAGQATLMEPPSEMRA